MTLRWRFAAAMAAVPLIVLTSCSKPDLSPVPTTAEPPYACDGVPRRGAELLMGGSITAEQIGGWNEALMACKIRATGGGSSSLKVFWETAQRHASEEDYEDRFGGFEGARPIVAHAPGSGHMRELDDGPFAWWVCDGTIVTVEPDLVDVEGRDLLTDTRDLLVSLLPWACAGEPVPSADASR